jgi:hypothetical protein
MQLQQQTLAARQNAAGVTTTQGVPQIRAPQVGISQQQRTGTPLSAANRASQLSPQQLLQAQAVQARAMQVAQQAQQAQAQVAAAQAHAVGVTVPNAVANGTHLSPPYVGRTTSSSPALPQAVVAGQPSSGTSPRPPPAQTVGVQPTTAAAGQRPAAHIAHYFPATVITPQQQFTAEQVIGLQAILVS